jgi:hypothetical protein
MRLVEGSGSQMKPSQLADAFFHFTKSGGVPNDPRVAQLVELLLAKSEKQDGKAVSALMV